MENRLKLNGKPNYTCPNLTIWQYNPYASKKTREECLKIKGQPQLRFRKQGKPWRPLKEDELKNTELGVYSQDDKIIDFIKNFDWGNYIDATSGSGANLPAYKILEKVKEEFYGK